MSEENKFGMVFMLAIMTLIMAISVTTISVVWLISLEHTTTARAAIEAGYEQQTLPGVSGVHWVKAP